jgi:chemotaxis response regulator CheB
VANPHPIRVLVVDDSEDFRRTLQLYLNTIPHIQIIGEATDGREAMFMVEKLKPTVVLMDINIPALDGIAATREIKQNILMSPS